MSITVLKPTKIVSAGLGLLTRETTLPMLVWRDAVGDFAGASGDTISIRLPAYATARTRALRSGAARTRDNLAETKVDVTLDVDVYKDVNITDEELTLDIAEFGTQVLNPITAAVAMKLEDELASTITGATYPASNTIEFDAANPFDSIVDVRTALNNARVPMSNRSLILGSTLEAIILKSDKFSRYDSVGGSASSVVEEARLGRIAGFNVYGSPAIDPDEAYAFHKTAFVMASRAPQVPAGAPYGAVGTYNGFAMRVVRVLDPDTIVDVLATDSWVGCNAVLDRGTQSGGIFTPSETGADGQLLVRAVKVVNLV